MISNSDKRNTAAIFFSCEFQQICVQGATGAPHVTVRDFFRDSVVFRAVLQRNDLRKFFGRVSTPFDETRGGIEGNPR